MKRFVSTLRMALAVSLCVGLIQAILGTVMAAALFADRILAPRDFFAMRWHDGYTKIYQLGQQALCLPSGPSTFWGQGFFHKLLAAPELLAINLVVAVPFGLLLALIFSVPAQPRTGGESRTVGRLLAANVMVQGLVLAGTWLVPAIANLPDQASLKIVGRNLARDLFYGGGLAAALVLVVTALLLFPLRKRLARWGWRASAASLALCLLASGLSDLAPERPAAVLRTPAAAQVTAKDYNVILISIDSLRADHLSAYGYHRDTSPTIAALAREGVLFRSTSSTTSWTLPAHMSMLTGRSLLGHGVIFHDRSLTADVTTLAEALQSAGYVTGAIVSAPYVESRYGFDKGFDDYDDQTIHFESNDDSYKKVTAPTLQEAASRWLTRHRDDRFFLFLHYWDVHYDYAPGAPYSTMFDPHYQGTVNGDNFYFNPHVNKDMNSDDLDHVIALYDGEIRLVDDHLALLRKKLSELGTADRTIIVVTADHGDEFFEHGRKGHHRTLYDEVVLVPLVVYVPGVVPTSPEIAMESSIIDIMPTILSLVGAPVPGGVEGQDLSGVAFHGSPQWKRSVQGELYRRQSLNVQVSLRRDGRKIIHHFFNNRLEAFDLVNDPGEQVTVAADRDFITPLLEELTTWLNRSWSVFSHRIQEQGVYSLEMDKDTRERLKSLGYIQ